MTLSLLGVALICGASTALADTLTIGTGSTAGVYYLVGRAICHQVNQGTAEHGIHCEAQSTAGSIHNLEQVRLDGLALAVAQSDWQFHAARGSAHFETAGPDGKLRALFSVHGEPFTVVARRDADIGQFDDLPGRRVNLGNPGSGQRGTMEVVMAAKGWTPETFLMAGQLPAAQQSLALCHDRIEAMVYTVGHPNASVRKAVSLCDAVLVPVAGPHIDKLVNDHPYYAHTTIPAHSYPGNPDPIRTFGVKATVVASSDLEPDTVYTLVKTLFENLESFRAVHPALTGLDPKSMATDGLSAPIHDGAMRYFQEAGLR
jgi:TRAP transporter TAXI family solute receptor